jgi:hypothetical protein
MPLSDEAMIRRITIACGFLTLATLFVLTWQDQTLSGTQSPGQVSVIPDKPMFWPPVKPLPAPPIKALPPVPQPKPLHGGTVSRPLPVTRQVSDNGGR